MKYKELKSELMLQNIDADYPKQYLHIEWRLLRKILKKAKTIE